MLFTGGVLFVGGGFGSRPVGERAQRERTSVNVRAVTVFRKELAGTPAHKTTKYFLRLIRLVILKCSRFKFVASLSCFWYCVWGLLVTEKKFQGFYLLCK